MRSTLPSWRSHACHTAPNDARHPDGCGAGTPLWLPFFPIRPRVHFSISALNVGAGEFSFPPSRASLLWGLSVPRIQTRRTSSVEGSRLSSLSSLSSSATMRRLPSNAILACCNASFGSLGRPTLSLTLGPRARCRADRSRPAERIDGPMAPRSTLGAVTASPCLLVDPFLRPLAATTNSSNGHFQPRVSSTILDRLVIILYRSGIQNTDSL